MWYKTKSYSIIVYYSSSKSNQESHNSEEFLTTLEPAVEKANKYNKALQEVDSKSTNLPGMQSDDQECKISNITLIAKPSDLFSFCHENQGSQSSVDGLHHSINPFYLDEIDAADSTVEVNKNMSLLYSIPAEYEDMLKGQYDREKLISEQLKTICEKLNFTSCSAFLFSGSSILACAGCWDKSEEIRVKLMEQKTKLQSSFAVRKVLNSQEDHSVKNLYGELQLLKSTDYSAPRKIRSSAAATNKAHSFGRAWLKPNHVDRQFFAVPYIDPEIKSVLNIYGTEWGEFEVILIPIHGFNRTYGYIKAVRHMVLTDSHLQESSVELIPYVEDEVGLGTIFQLCQRAARLGSILKEAKRSEQLRLILFLQRIDLQWSEINKDINNLDFQSLKDYLHFFVNFLTSSEYRCVNSVTLRLVLNDILYEVSHKTYNDQGIKDNSPRSVDEQPQNIVSSVIYDGLDIYYYNIDDPEFSKKYNLKNQEWIFLNKFSTLSCLAIKVKNQTVGTLSLFSGKHQVLGEEDRRFLRIVANLAANFLSRVLFDINADQKHLDYSRVRSFLDDLYPIKKVIIPNSLYHKSFSIVSATNSTHHVAEKLDRLLHCSHNIRSNIHRTLAPDDYLLESDYIFIIFDTIALTDLYFTRQIWPKVLLNYRARPHIPIILISIEKLEIPSYMQIFDHMYNSLMEITDIENLLEYVKSFKMVIQHGI
jgi:hypothetical protein